MGTGSVAGGAGGVFLTTLLGTTLLGDQPTDVQDLNLPLTPVNVDQSLLSEWLSESYDSYSDEPLSGECQYFNFSRSYTSDFCDAFTLSRMQPGTIHQARMRALKCATKGETECILSHEVGLAIPVAFLARQDEKDGIKVIIAPRNITMRKDDPTPKRQHIRIHDPTDTFTSKRVLFYDTVRVEFLSASRTIENELFTDSEAFCLELLRASYDSECWRKLDGQ
jgi:hypothetical protein